MIIYSTYKRVIIGIILSITALILMDYLLWEMKLYSLIFVFDISIIIFSFLTFKNYVIKISINNSLVHLELFGGEKIIIDKLISSNKKNIMRFDYVYYKKNVQIFYVSNISIVIDKSFVIIDNIKFKKSNKLYYLLLSCLQENITNK